MRILIITSKDHPYATAVLNSLIRSGALSSHDITIWEQDWVVPHCGKMAGLLRYWRLAGTRYILAQVGKQLLFRLRRTWDGLCDNRNSPFFPYHRHSGIALQRTFLQDMRSSPTLERLSTVRPDLILSILSKEILPKEILQLPPLGCVNLHPALLPSYRGVSPTFWCLANHERCTGVTLHYMDEGYDTGQIITQRQFSTAGFTTEHALYMHCTCIGAGLLVAFLQQDTPLSPLDLHTRGAPAKRSYHSIPTREAVARFRTYGYRFFSLQEFLCIL